MTVQTGFTHPTVKKLFAGRKLVVASMHGKQTIMRPLIKQFLNVDTTVSKGLNTDEFGTFSGEVERGADPVTTVRNKIRKGLELTGETLGIGSEGSFAPHPHNPFLQVNHEVVMLIDLVHNLEIYETVVSTETNHCQREIGSMRDLMDFTEKVNFPSHGIILKQVKNGETIAIRKGIITWELLHATAFQFNSADTQLIAESDMRAYLNPSRLKIIERATEKLMKRVTSLCPECQWPGFGQVEVKEGLPCSQCGEPTPLPLSKVYACGHCHYADTRSYSDAQHASPQYCLHCNP